MAQPINVSATSQVTGQLLRAGTAVRHTSAAYTAAPSTFTLSYTTRQHAISSLTAKQTRAFRSHAMAHVNVKTATPRGELNIFTIQLTFYYKKCVIWWFLLTSRIGSHTATGAANDTIHTILVACPVPQPDSHSQVHTHRVEVLVTLEWEFDHTQGPKRGVRQLPGI